MEKRIIEERGIEKHNDEYYYQLMVKGHLAEHWSGAFQGLTISHKVSDGIATTCIEGFLADQAALHSLLDRIHDMGLMLLLVKQVSPPLV